MAFTPHPALHTVFEALGYFIGYRVFKVLRARSGDFLTDEHRWLLLAATALGALAGSRVLGLLEQAPRIGWHWAALFAPTGGKTIVGGLLGGWLGAELAKLALHVRSRTGDLYAVPLALGIAIGRIGCFAACPGGRYLRDTTTLPWGVNFGDGITRHPTQLYELVFLLLLAAALTWYGRRPHPQGQLFRIFMGAYLGVAAADRFHQAAAARARAQHDPVGLRGGDCGCAGGVAHRAGCAASERRPSCRISVGLAARGSGLAAGSIRSSVSWRRNAIWTRLRALSLR